MKLVPDHLLIAAPDLDAGIRFSEEKLGVRPVPGGSHPGQGTRNALLGLEDDIYIEIIAPDPAQPPDLPLASYLRSLDTPALSWWCARCDDLVALKRQLGAEGINSGPIDPWSRTLPDGSSLRWHLLMPGDSPFGALLPFCINWEDMTRHPSRQLPTVGRLESLVIRHPAVGEFPASIDDSVSLESGGPPAMTATLQIADRSVILDSGDELPTAIGAIAGY